MGKLENRNVERLGNVRVGEGTVTRYRVDRSQGKVEEK